MVFRHRLRLSQHQVCLLDAHGQFIEERIIDHTGDGVAVLLLWLKRLIGDSFLALAVSLESPHGALIEALLDQGATVFALNPKQLDRFRDRFTVAGAKDDRRDAYVLAASMRTDLPAFRKLQAPDALTVRIRELSRTLETITVTNAAGAISYTIFPFATFPPCFVYLRRLTTSGYGVYCRWLRFHQRRRGCRRKRSLAF